MSDWDMWEPWHGPYEPQPDPCQYCSVMSGVLVECDHTCDTLTKARWLELTKAPDAV